MLFLASEKRKMTLLSTVELKWQMHDECVKKALSFPPSTYIFSIKRDFAKLVDDKEMLVMLKVINVQNMKKKKRKQILPFFLQRFQFENY